MLLDQAIAKLPSVIDLETVRGVVNEQTTECPLEAAVFKPYEDFDDILAIEDLGIRKVELLKVSDAITAVNDRRRRLAAALSAVAEDSIQNDEELEEFRAAKRRLIGGMDNHIPDAFLAASLKLKDRVNTLCLSDEAKAELLVAEKQGFGQELEEQHAELFRKAVEPNATKKMERFDFYFDQLIATPPIEDLQAIAQVQDEMIKKAHRVRDAGGTLDDVKEVLSHIPETFWPPEFVEELQAWRKTERALQRERVAEAAKKQSDAMATTQGACAFFADIFGDVADFAAVAELTIVNDYIKLWRNGWNLGEDFAEGCKNCDFSKTSAQKASEAFETISDVTGQVVAAIKNLAEMGGNVSGLANDTFLMGTFLPGLSIALAGIDLTRALKALAEHSHKTVQSESMKKLAKLELARRELPDGGAFVRAMDNEIGARHRQVAKDSVEITVKSVELAGGIVELTAGPAAPAGTVLKIVGKSINYGGKIIFTNIEWNIAQKAKELISEAQAGNPIARMQIFEDCGLYAKMYICVLCKEGHPLSLKFIEQRGIEEADLDTVSSLKILRELLMDSAGQADETEAADTRLGANAGALGKVASAVATKMSRILKSSSKAYDPNWSPSSPADLTKATWETIKSEARTAGWYEESTGIAAAMTQVESTLPAAQATWPEFAQSSTEQQRAVWKSKNIAARDALGRALGIVRSYSPMTCPHVDANDKTVVVPHKGMCIYIKQLGDELNKTITELETKVNAEHLRSLTWATTDSNLSSTEWKANFLEAVDSAWLPNQEPGIEAVLRVIESTDPSSIVELQAKRAANIRKRDALNEFVKLANAYWTQCGEVSGMRDYLTRLLRQAADQAKVLDIAMFETPWNDPFQTMAAEKQFTSAGWSETWEAACDAGVCNQSAGDAGLLSALQNYETKANNVESGPTGKALLRARVDAANAAASVYAKAAKFTSVQTDTVKGVYEHVKAIIDRSAAFVSKMDSDRAATTFAPTAVTNLSSTEWNSAYTDAVAQGALPENSAASKLKDALNDYKKEAEKLAGFISSSKFKEQRAQAPKVQSALGKVISEIGHVEAGDGYTSHTIMGEILSDLRSQANEKMADEALQKILDGDMRASFTTHPAFTPDNWSGIKQEAINKGVIPDAPTGMKETVKATQKAIAAVGKAKPEKLDAAIADAKAQLQSFRSLARQLKKLSKHANWTAYADSIVQWAVSQEAAL